MNKQTMVDDKAEQSRRGLSANNADLTLAADQEHTRVSLSGRQVVRPPQKSFAVDDPLIGQCLGGQYLIQAPLGSGGMSVVYKALNQAIERQVAVKTIKLTMNSDPVILARFEREIKSLGRLNHLNIVTVYDCIVSEQGQPYIVMDYIDGDGLDNFILEEGALDQTRVAKIFIQVCAALEHAHRQGIVHRDLKPGNIMITRDGSGTELVKVLDFGLAKLMEENQRLTSTGQLWGSLPYMSPEQCNTTTEGSQIDHRTDIYSLGIAMYESLTGKRPFVSENVIEIVAKQLYEDPLPFRECNPNVHIVPNLEAVVFTALRKSRDERFKSMREMKEAIEFAAGPLLTAEKNLQEEMMQQRQSDLRNSVRRSGSKKKPESLNVYLQKKKKQDLKIPVIAGCAAIVTGALVYFVMAGSHAPSPIPSPSPVSAPSVPSVPSAPGVPSAPNPAEVIAPMMHTDIPPAALPSNMKPIAPDSVDSATVNSTTPSQTGSAQPSAPDSSHHAPVHAATASGGSNSAKKSSKAVANQNRIGRTPWTKLQQEIKHPPATAKPKENSHRAPKKGESAFDALSKLRSDVAK